MYSPPPPPQAGRAFVRSMFSRRGRKPDVAATLLSHADATEIEFVNSGAAARSIAWTTGSSSGTASDLAPGESTSVHFYEPPDEDFRCVWTALDDRGRMHIWSYDGRHVRLARGGGVSPAEAFAQMYG